MSRQNRQWIVLLHLGWSIAGILTLFVGGGHLLDRSMGTSPLWTLVGMVIAILSVGTMIWKAAKDLERGEKNGP